MKLSGHACTEALSGDGEAGRREERKAMQAGIKFSEEFGLLGIKEC